MYLTNCTRPDIAYSVSKLSRFTSNPSADHWKALTRALRYLKYTMKYGILYKKYPTVLEGYCDANWISDTKDSKVHKWVRIHYWWRSGVMEILQTKVYSQIHDGV